MHLNLEEKYFQRQLQPLTDYDKCKYINVENVHTSGLQITTRPLANASNFVGGRQDLKDFIGHMASIKFCRTFPEPDWGLTRLLNALLFSLNNL